MMDAPQPVAHIEGVKASCPDGGQQMDTKCYTMRQCHVMIIVNIKYNFMPQIIIDQ